MGDENVIDYDDDDGHDDEDNEDDDDGDEDEDDDNDNATINCWKKIGRMIQEKEMTTMMMTTMSMMMTTMTMMTTTMTTAIPAMTMNITMTKQQSTVGNNRGSRIGEKRRFGGVG